jgi:hypothetical protein
VRLRVLDAGVVAEIEAGGAVVEVVDTTLFDLNGNALRPEYGTRPAASTTLFLPLILQGSTLQGAGAGEEVQGPSPEATVEVAVEATPEATPMVTEPAPEAQSTGEAAAEVEATPTSENQATPEATPVPSATLVPADPLAPVAE